MEITKIIRVGYWLDWESEVVSGNVIFYFRAFTKRGARRKAERFIKEHA